MNQTIGVVLIVAGVVLTGVGVLAYTGLLGWFGRLPGDISFESGNTRVYIPITSMLVVSVVLSVVGHIITRFFR
jgi:membrane protein implicated in regulation of membrane protease activity